MKKIFLSRLATIVLGYLAAGAAAGMSQAIIFIGILIVGSLGDGELPRDIDFLTHFLKLFGSLVVWSTMAIAALAALPSMLGIIFTEYHGIQTRIFYLSAGIVVSLLTSSALFAVLYFKTFSGSAPAPEEILLGIVTYSPPGIVAGFVYWSIAGHSAGNWWRGTMSSTSPAPSES